MIEHNAEVADGASVLQMDGGPAAPMGRGSEVASKNSGLATAATGDPVDLAIANASLAAENRELKRAAQSQKLGKLLGNLRFLGKLTPGLEQAGAAEILSAVWELETGTAGFQPAHESGQDARAPRQPGNAITVTLPDGTELPLGEAIAGLLYAIPPSWGGEGYASGPGFQPGMSRGKDRPLEAAATQSFDYAPLPPRLSPQERDIARTLGLTAEEYIGITAEG